MDRHLSTGPGGPNNPTDWALIEREYRAGQLSIAEIARQSGITRSAIQKRAKRDVWARDLLPAVQAKVKDKLVRDAAPEGALEAEAVDAAAARGRRGHGSIILVIGWRRPSIRPRTNSNLSFVAAAHIKEGVVVAGRYRPLESKAIKPNSALALRACLRRCATA
jgi:hypothetical protein